MMSHLTITRLIVVERNFISGVVNNDLQQLSNSQVAAAAQSHLDFFCPRVLMTESSGDGADDTDV